MTNETYSLYDSETNELIESHPSQTIIDASLAAGAEGHVRVMRMAGTFTWILVSAQDRGGLRAYVRAD